MSRELEIESYLKDRVSQYRTWYDKKAVTAKSRYLSMRAFTVIAGGLVPVLINLNIDMVPAAVTGLVHIPQSVIVSTTQRKHAEQ